MSTQSKKAVYELTLIIKKNKPGMIEVIKGLLTFMGFDEGDIVEMHMRNQVYLSVYVTTLAKAKRLKNKFKNLDFPNIEVVLKSLLNKDWQTKWKKDFKPFAITPEMEIVPLWMKKKHKVKKRIPVYIDSGMAFGTGMHATTRMVAQYIGRCQNCFESFLDIGTGTGILALIALKYGASSVCGIDICPEAIKHAKINMKENDCVIENLKVVDLQKYKMKEKFDFVAANLITHDLMNLSKEIIARVNSGKYLAVSGISLNNYEIFREKFNKLPLRCLKIEKSEGWVALLYKRM